MAQIILPQRYLSQPQYHVEIAPEYADAEVLALFNTAEWVDLSGNHSLTSLSSPTSVIKQHGRSQRYGDVLGTHVRTSGNIPAMPRFTAMAWVRPGVMGGGYKRILETNYSVNFYLGSSNGGAQYNFIVANSSLSACVGGNQIVGERDFVAGVYNGTHCILYVNGREVARTAASAPTLATHLCIGANQGNTNSGEHWVGDIDTVAVFPRAFSDDQMLSLYNDPYQIIRRPNRRIFFTPSAPSSEATGSAYGTSTASGVGSSGSVSSSTGTAAGTSTASATGTSAANSAGSSSGLASASGIGVAEVSTVGAAAGTSTVSGVGVSATGSSGAASGTSTANASGSSTAASNGTANGVAAASGIGVSVAAVSGSASGLATVAGVGDSIIPGSATGTASGTSTASAIGASIAASTGSASGDSTATGKGSSTGGVVESYSGGYLYISREEREEIKRRQRIKLGIIEEEKPDLEKFEITELVKPKKKLIPARQQKKIDHEAINAELKALLKKQIDREQEIEEQTILKMLMEL